MRSARRSKTPTTTRINANPEWSEYEKTPEDNRNTSYRAVASWGEQEGNQTEEAAEMDARRVKQRAIEVNQDLNSLLEPFTFISLAADGESSRNQKGRRMIRTVKGDRKRKLQAHQRATTSEPIEFGLRDARDLTPVRVGPKFSRAQRRNGVLTWSRIDRVYTSDFEVLRIIHHAQFWASDHVPVSVELTGSEELQQKMEVCKSTYFKADHKVVEENLNRLRQVWEERTGEGTARSAMENFLLGWAGIRSEVKKLQYDKARQLTMLPEMEIRLQRLTQKIPSSLSAEEQEEMGRLIAEVRDLQAWRNHRWLLTGRENFLKDGEANSAYFFRRFKTRRNKVKIEKIRKEDGTWTQGPEEVKREVLKGFTQLYKKEPDTEEAQRARRKLMNSIHQTLTREQRIMLDECPSERELAESLALLPAGKSPGIDGFGKESMISLWPVVGTMYSQAMEEFWLQGEFPSSFKEGLLVLLPNVDDPETLGQWRPITMLNTTYKVIAKVASGGKVNIQKSKVLMIGKKREAPPWLTGWGLQIVGRNVQNQEGIQKRPLVGWDQVAVPERWGGLGVYELQLFQQALLVRTMLKAFANPEQTIWAPILQTVFLQSQHLDFASAVSMCALPRRLPGCPVAALLLEAWSDWISRLRWTPTGDRNLRTEDVFGGAFMLARAELDVTQAAELATKVRDWCQREGYHSLIQLKMLSPEELRVLTSGLPQEVTMVWSWLQEVRFVQTHEVFDPQEWTDATGDQIRVTWRGVQIYESMLTGKEAKQVEILNGKWRLNWGVQDWRGVVSWAIQAPGKQKWLNVWLLAVVWRVLWAERCVLKYHGKRNRVSSVKVAYSVMEELAARRHKIKEEARRFCAQQLIPILPVTPPRFLQLLE
ncbi:hypothetical protein R1sor_001842 [Riccia sorocarpa]|uniref:Reverse transcriptase n=1 Tax=Riccia sorocarpa TaxID=122646 RepID=A0ABD3GX22_9MARC